MCNPAVQALENTVNHTAPSNQCTIAATRTATQFMRMESPSLLCANNTLFQRVVQTQWIAHVQYRLRTASLLAQPAQADGVVTLGQPHTSLIAHQFAMVIGGNGQPERANQQQLPRRRFQQIGAAD